MRRDWRRVAAILIFLGLSILGLWGSKVAWASPGQSPAQQTVPTRGPTPTATNTPHPVAATSTPVPAGVMTNTPVPRTATPVPGTTSVPATSAPLVPTSAAAPSMPDRVMATANDNLRIRSGPSTGAAVVGQLKKGESAQVMGRSAASDWLQITLPTNPAARGWVAALYVTTGMPVSAVPVVSGPSVAAPPTTVLLPPTAPSNTPAPVPPTAVLPSATAPRLAIVPSATMAAAMGDVERPTTGNPLATIVIAIVVLGLLGGLVLVSLGVVVTALNRR